MWCGRGVFVVAISIVIVVVLFETRVPYKNVVLSQVWVATIGGPFGVIH